MSKMEPTAFLETFAALRRALSVIATRAYASLEMGTTQVRFLRHIGEHRYISQAALARATITDPALTGRTLSSLVERGLIRRERGEEDKREFLLSLTPEGQKTLRRVLRLREQLADRLTAPLDERDLNDFARIAQKLMASFADEALAPPDAQ